MKCAICEDELDTTDRQTIRLSSSQPPWSYRSGLSAIAAIGDSFAEVVRAATGEPPVTLWFHRHCWAGFLDLLQNGLGG